MAQSMFPNRGPETLETKIRSKWSKLTEQDVESLHGNLNILPDKIQQVYGKPKDVAEKEVAEFRQTLSGGSSSIPTSPTSQKSSNV